MYKFDVALRMECVDLSVFVFGIEKEAAGRTPHGVCGFKSVEYFAETEDGRVALRMECVDLSLQFFSYISIMRSSRTPHGVRGFKYCIEQEK